MYIEISQVSILQDKHNASFYQNVVMKNSLISANLRKYMLCVNIIIKFLL